MIRIFCFGPYGAYPMLTIRKGMIVKLDGGGCRLEGVTRKTAQRILAMLARAAKHGAGHPSVDIDGHTTPITAAMAAE